MTDEEKAAANARGAAAGVRHCPVCLDSALWKPFHHTPFFSGTIETGLNSSFDGELCITVLCESCWRDLSPEKRLGHYREAMDRRLENVRKPRKLVVLQDVEVQVELLEDTPEGPKKVMRKVTRQEPVAVDNAAEIDRYEKELAEADSDWLAIQNAVLGGK